MFGADIQRREIEDRGLVTMLAMHDGQAVGFSQLRLASTTHNQRAIAFYRKLGFEPKGSYHFMLGMDRQRDLIMAKRVD